MFRHSVVDEQISWRTYADWFLLAFLSGSVNAGGFLACRRFVTHVTGFASLFGIDAAQGKWDQGFGILTVPIFFLIGVMVSAYLVDRPTQRGQRPHYASVMALVAFNLLAVAIFGQLHYFGEFGNELRLKQDYLMLAMLCMASGLQNAAVSTASGLSVRTTHLTGLTTDLGTGLVRAWALRRNPSHVRHEMRAARFRMGVITSFGLGGAAGAVLCLKFHYLGFLLPFFLACYAVWEALEKEERPWTGGGHLLSRWRKKPAVSAEKKPELTQV